MIFNELPTTLKDSGFTSVNIINGQTAIIAEVQKSFLAALNYFYTTVKTTKQF